MICNGFWTKNGILKNKLKLLNVPKIGEISVFLKIQMSVMWTHNSLGWKRCHYAPVGSRNLELEAGAWNMKLGAYRSVMEIFVFSSFPKIQKKYLKKLHFVFFFFTAVFGHFFITNFPPQRKKLVIKK
jgi:hypothetical protein